jgi:hypothetical protein
MTRLDDWSCFHDMIALSYILLDLGASSVLILPVK